MEIGKPSSAAVRAWSVTLKAKRGRARSRDDCGVPESRRESKWPIYRAPELLDSLGTQS